MAWGVNQRVAPVVRHMNDLTIVGRNVAFWVSSKQHTNEGAALQPVFAKNKFWGQIGGQTIATVQGKTIWLTAAVDLTANSQVAAAETANWSVTGWYRLPAQYCGDSPRSIAVAAGDLDGDGDDEMVVTTLNTTSSIDTAVVQISYGGNPGSPKLSLDPEPLVHKTLAQETAPQQVDVAIGDLDGDGRKNEVVVAYNTTWDVTSPGKIGMYIYRYQDDGLQLQGKVQSFTPWNGDDQPLDSASVWDFEIATGQVRPTSDDSTQLVLAVALAVPQKKGYDLGWDAYLYAWSKDQRDERALAEIEQKYGFGPLEAKDADDIWGAYSIALATGDIIGDGLDEIVFAHPLRLYTSAAAGCHDCFSDNYEATVRSLAVGDVDGDARAEIIRATNRLGNSLDVIKWADVPHEVREDADVFTNTHLYAEGHLAGFSGVPLLADLTGDSLQAKLDKCETFKDANVIAVVNAAPRFYEGEEPVQESGGGYATGNSDINGTETGTVGIYGGSVGFSREMGGPSIFGWPVEVTLHIEAEFLGRSGQSKATEETVKTESGTKLVNSESRGFVVYNESSYKCCSFRAYYPSAPEDTSTILSCSPSDGGAPEQKFETLEDWHSPSFKSDHPSSWVDVGRASAPEVYSDTNDVYTYPDTLPVDPYLVKWHDTSIGHTVDSQSHPEQLPFTWSLEKSKKEEQVHKGSFENKYTVGASFKIVKFEADIAAIGGFEKEWSRTVGWEESLSFEGEVFDYADTCPTETCAGEYKVQPFLWQTTATSEAGVTYPYLEVDYYVPDPPGTLVANAEGKAAKEAILGIAPQQPVISSPTHPDPGTWYAGREVTFDWGQPAGDPAVVIGYRWNLNDKSDFTPTALHRVMTDTLTFIDVPDGSHFFHLQARGDGGDDSPVAHRAVRVDATPPQVDILLDPQAPDGLDDWYKMPVEATVAATDGADSGESGGSGVATVEVSSDGATWQPYTAPIGFNTPTAGTTLWARATDQAGHTSEPVSATLKIDLHVPTSVDSDGLGLSYHNVSTDEVGNAMLTLGGASQDTLAGRFMVEVKGADTGLWHAVHKVGEFPMPPDNDLPSTMKTLNWVYTPTREIRGIYPLWGRSIDAAGNTEEEWAFGTFWWEPEGEPDLSESQASVSPQSAFPGDTVRFTLGIRNTGVQESQVAFSHTLPHCPVRSATAASTTLAPAPSTGPSTVCGRERPASSPSMPR